MRKITVITPDGEAVLRSPDGKNLLELLSKNGFTVPAACGRKGICGKCRVKLLSGSFGDEAPDEKMTIRSCKAFVCGNAVIGVDFRNGGGLAEFSSEVEIQNGSCGIAVDIGTTTVSATFIKKNGTSVSLSCINPQSAYGADVVSRIEACLEGKLNELTSLIRKCIKELIEKLDIGNEAEELVVSGNTTMLHLFCGISPDKMGAFPFTPEFTDVQFLDGSDIGLSIKKITVLPSVSAFIGSDIVAGIYALGLHKTDRTVFLADLGTNGELVLSDKGKLYCTSTAAGPALEGACIECGVGGIDGAIDKVFDEDGEIGFTTIGNAKPIGICGAGITDAVALLLYNGLIDQSGYLEKNIPISADIYISPNDIRQFQLAKSAIYSGIETLIETVGINNSRIDSFFIAGGLGYYINPESAFIVGLLPRFGNGKVKAVGNTSLQGAVMCIGNGNAVEEMRNISKQCTLVDLGGNSDFSHKFMDNMFFTDHPELLTS